MSDELLEESNQVSAAMAKEGKYLTFALSSENYGIEILKVREIIGMMNITNIPQVPPYVKGVINLRGKVIPVIDLRLKFGMDQIDPTPETCIIVVTIQDIFIGLLIDQVNEVLDIPAKDIEPSPKFGAAIQTEFILGIGKVRESIKILLNIEKVLGDDVQIAGGLNA